MFNCLLLVFDRYIYISVYLNRIANIGLQYESLGIYEWAGFIGTFIAVSQ